MVDMKVKFCEVCSNPCIAQGSRRTCSELCRFVLHVSAADDKECWLWWHADDAVNHHDGYGTFSTANPKRSVRAHRWGYEALVGPIPDGLELDHLCRNKICVNPDHLEPVTHSENVMRDYQARGLNKC